jgi:hypothetical protein
MSTYGNEISICYEVIAIPRIKKRLLEKENKD